MSAIEPIQMPVRVGVFSSLINAERTVDALFRAGFRREEVSVLAPASVAAEFGGLAEQSASSKSAEGAAAGGAIGALLGGLGLIAGIAATGGIGVLAAGALGAGFGGVVGGLVGAMTMRGVQKEYADYYDQSIAKGKILVSVESPDESRQKLAELIFAANGAEPVALPEG